jgi:hypothetical protein
MPPILPSFADGRNGQGLETFQPGSYATLNIRLLTDNSFMRPSSGQQTAPLIAHAIVILLQVKKIFLNIFAENLPPVNFRSFFHR